jgi:hypothetical protein
MSIFLESPVPILSIGIFVELVLAIALWQTGRGRVLLMMLGVLAVMAGGWLLQWLVVTDYEAIDDLLHDCASAVVANDVNRALSHISPSAKQVQAAARQVFEEDEVTMAKITDLQIAVNRRANPRTAKATFNAIGRGRDRKGQIPETTYGCHVIVKLRKEGDRWFIADYSLEDLELPGSRSGKP